MKKILFIKLCCLGDLLQMLPAISTVRSTHPETQIDFLASGWVQELIKRIPAVNHWIPWQEPYEAIPAWRKAASTLRMARILREQEYDAVLIGHRSGFFPALAMAAGIPTRIGFGTSPFLTHKALFDEKTHESKRYLELAKGLDLSLRGGDETRAALSILPEDMASAERLLSAHKIPASFISIFPGGGNNPGTRMPVKQWPKEKWVELIKTFPGTEPILLLGDSQDAAIAYWIKEQTPAFPVIDLTGKTSFSALIGILAKSRRVIGGDSGPLHIAAALGRPTLMLFGPSDPRLVAPQGAKVLWKQVKCAPCYTPQSVLDKTKFKNGEFPCWTGTHECMNTLSVEEVAAQI